jgi:DNA-binding IclR family transcriptional regulator
MADLSTRARSGGDQSETTLRRGVGILFALGSDEASRSNGLGVVRLAEIVGREKSQVSRSLKTLVECGVLDRDPRTLQYRLSWRLLAVAARAGDARLLQTASPLLDDLVDRLGETAHLSVLRGAEVLTVLTRASSQVVQATSWVGRTISASCSSSGRALLLDHDAEQLRRLFSGHSFTAPGPNAPRDVDDLARRVVSARARGCAVVAEESEPGLSGVAAPVRDARGVIVAAVNISAPTFRLAGRTEEACGEVVATAAALSRLLGCGCD